MRLPSRSRRLSGAANMTPMIDVVFLLIIFFLVSSHLARQESRIPLDLPIADGTNIEMTNADILTVNIGESGVWMVGGMAASEAKLDELMLAHRKEHGEDAALRVRTDRRIPYGQVEPVLRAAAGAGLWNASFAVYREVN